MLRGLEIQQQNKALRRVTEQSRLGRPGIGHNQSAIQLGQEWIEIQALQGAFLVEVRKGASDEQVGAVQPDIGFGARAAGSGGIVDGIGVSAWVIGETTAGSDGRFEIRGPLGQWG